jgi:adenylosuccinate lyase
MALTSLTAVTPTDGRYRKQTASLDNYFSEFALMKYRVQVEVAYFIFLAQKKFFKLPAAQQKKIQNIADSFSLSDANHIKALEATTNHDVKAVEYFIKEQLDKIGPSALKEWVHFRLTSQDVNNTAIPLSWKDRMELEYLPALFNLKQQIKRQAQQWKKISMLARTHGQPASPTTLAKEWIVFVERIDSQIALFTQIPYTAKIGGANGNFNAHVVAFPHKNWIQVGNEFVDKKLGLQRQQFTTQIEHYDCLAAHLDAIHRINNILIDFCRDVWTYISLDYFKQKTKQGEVGSTAMPHKVNPIDFENAEGNLGMANAIANHLANKFPISRLQRDLTDSTVLRNLGLPIPHTMIALQSIAKGMSKLVLNEAKLASDLDANWAVVVEAIQTILRRENYPNPYEALKALTRGKEGINQKTLHQFIDELKISAALKKQLKSITPHNYIGVAPGY